MSSLHFEPCCLPVDIKHLLRVSPLWVRRVEVCPGVSARELQGAGTQGPVLTDPMPWSAHPCVDAHLLHS